MKLSQDASKILEVLSEAIKKARLIEPRERVLVALSGGADSVALLTRLHCLSGKLNIELFAAHLNHGIRGAEADRDESFCVALCKNHGVPIMQMYDEAVGKVEDVIITAQHGNNHYRYAKPYIKTGVQLSKKWKIS